MARGEGGVITDPALALSSLAALALLYLAATLVRLYLLLVAHRFDRYCRLRGMEM